MNEQPHEIRVLLCGPERSLASDEPVKCFGCKVDLFRNQTSDKKLLVVCLSCSVELTRIGREMAKNRGLSDPH